MAKSNKKRLIVLLFLILSFGVFSLAFTSSLASPATKYIQLDKTMTLPSTLAISQCGDGHPNNGPAYKPSIDIGCIGHGNAIEDALFGIIKFLTDGAGLVIVASLIYAGIQYTASRGDPQATAQAVKRIRSNVLALLIDRKST